MAYKVAGLLDKMIIMFAIISCKGKPSAQCLVCTDEGLCGSLTNITGFLSYTIWAS